MEVLSDPKNFFCFFIFPTFIFLLLALPQTQSIFIDLPKSKKNHFHFFKPPHSPMIPGCRQCGHKVFTEILSLGESAISNFLSPEHDAKITIPKGPLDLVLCQHCSLIQLKHPAMAPSLLFHQYWYKSGTNKTMIAALKDVVQSAQKDVTLENPVEDAVLDIGANDGTLLQAYEMDPRITRYAFEPAKNICVELRQRLSGSRCVVLNEFFSLEAFQRISQADPALPRKVKVITSIAMFYAVEDPRSFVKAVKQMMHEDGIWIIQMAHLSAMLEQNNFDNICHEHVTYYCLRSLEFLLHSEGLTVYRVSLNDVNGGSFRVYIKHTESSLHPVEESVFRQREIEFQMRLHDADVYQRFGERVDQERQKLMDFIETQHKAGKRIHVYGASTKGNTLLQYYGLNHEKIEVAAERNRDKWGLKTVVSNIPIVSEEESRQMSPDFYLVLPWHFKTEFIEREQEFLKRGGAFIFPLPQFEVVR